MSERIEFTNMELHTSFGVIRGPGHLKVLNPAAGERVDENWLWNELDRAQHEWDALPENARPFYVPPAA